MDVATTITAPAPPATPFRFYQCTLPNNTDMVWKCAHAKEKPLDMHGIFTSTGYSIANFYSPYSLPFYDQISRKGCFASRKEAQRIVVNIGVKAWLPDSLDPLFVASRLPGGVLFEKNKD